MVFDLGFLTIFPNLRQKRAAGFKNQKFENLQKSYPQVRR
jgi:hypothetical protein